MNSISVSEEEGEGSPESFPIDPVDPSIFFEEDGKIYGYQGLKAGKGVMDLKTSLQNIFADNLAETKDDFFKTFSTENQYIKYIYDFSWENTSAIYELQGVKGFESR